MDNQNYFGKYNLQEMSTQELIKLRKKIKLSYLIEDVRFINFILKEKNLVSNETLNEHLYERSRITSDLFKLYESIDKVIIESIIEPDTAAIYENIKSELITGVDVSGENNSIWRLSSTPIESNKYFTHIIDEYNYYNSILSLVRLVIASLICAPIFIYYFNSDQTTFIGSAYFIPVLIVLIVIYCGIEVFTTFGKTILKFL